MGLLGKLAAGLGIVNQTTDLAGPPASIMPPDRTVWRDDDAWTLDAVYRSISLLAGSATQLSIDAQRAGVTMARRPLILEQPDLAGGRELSWFIEETMVSLASRGNAYWRHTLDDAGTVINLEVLDPFTVLPARDSNRTRCWHVEGERLYADRISHLQLLRRPGKLEGLGPLQACRISVAGAVDLRRWADQWLDESKTPNGILSTDQDIDAAQARATKKRFMDSTSYRKGPAVLGRGIAYAPLLITPTEMQWLESQRFNVSMVARLFGIPPRKLLVTLEGSSQTYANAEQDALDFVRDSLMPYLREIEAAFTRILPRGTRARWNLEALLRTDTKSRYEAYKMAIDAGFLTTDEVRAQEHLA